MIKNFFNVAGADAVKRIAEWIRHKFYTKTEIDDMLSAGMKYEVVNELPATGEAGTVYLVPKQSAGTGDVYDEYIYVDGSYEHIGSTEIDLSNYYTKTQADDLLGDKVDKESGKGLSTNDFTTAEKTKLGGIEAGAEVNVQSDWNQSDNTKDDYIKNKPTLRQPSTDGTSGQYLKSNGNGNAPSWETMDSSPTANSTKAVTSGGVKTALDGKQASISITTKTDDAGDNDKVILQANGVTDTTTFVRRSLSNLLNWFRSKLDEVYVPFGWIAMNEVLGMTPRLYNTKLDDVLWGADKRYDVTWKVYDGTTHEQLYDKSGYIQTLFNGTFEGRLEHPVTGEYEVLTIQPKDNDGSQTLRTYWQGTLILYFYYTHAPNEAPTCRIKQRNSNTWTTLTATKLRGSAYKINLAVTPSWYYLNTLEITIQGKTDTTEGGGTSLRGLVWIPSRYTYAESSVVTKYAQSQSLYGDITAPKFITRGGTSSQYLRGDGSLTTLSTSPTSGSGLPITSGAVYTALNNKQNKFLTFDIPDNSGYATLTLISDITESLSTPNWTGHGIIGFMYGWRAGNLSGSTAQRITCWGNHDTSYVKLQTDNNDNNALKPLLVYYNSRYYLALKKGKRSGMTHYFIGQSANILSTLINLYANSNESKWYSDSGRTTEVTFTITKDYSRYEGGYLDFMGNSSQVVLGTGELKTIDSSVASGSSNLVTSGAVATAINGIDTSGKVNLQPDFTASQIDYSAGNVGKWQKVLRFPEGADLVINMKKTAMGSDSTSTLWFSSSSMGDSYTSLFGNHSVRFVHDGGYVFLVLACRKSTYEPIESYTFQIAHSSVPMSDIVAVTDASPITATPKEPNIVYRAPMTTGAVSFNVTSSGTGSVYMSGHNDFLGNMTSEATNGVTVTMSGATEGQIYRFVFTRNITGGVTFKQSNVAYCTISGDVNAGDTITLTAVSNTEDGWLYEQESAGMTSTDGSVSIDYSSGIPDLSVEKVPFNNLVNKAMFQEVDSPYPLAIGEEAEAVMYDTNGDLLRTDTAQVWLSSVDGGNNAYSHSVTRGETYSVKIGSDTVSYTATATGSLFVCKTGSAYATESVTDGIWYKNGLINFTVVGAERVLSVFIIAVTSNTISFSKFDIINYINRTSTQYSNYWNTAIGKGTKCLSYASLALGYSYAYGGFSLALHRGKALGYNSIAIGNATANNYSVAIGNNANALFDNNCIAIGNTVMARGERSLALGYQSYSDGQEDVALGVYCKSGRLVTRDSVNYDRLLIKKFPLAKFSVAGSQCFGYKNISNISESVSLTYGGNSYVVNVESGRTLMLVNDADAVNIYDSVFGGIEIDGVTYASVGSYSLSMFTLTPIVGNVYAITILEGLEEYGDASSSSAYIYAHYAKSDYSSSYGIAVGNSCESVAGGKAFGQKLVAMNYYQTVIGRYNRLSDSSKFLIGGGTTDANRRNILEIDNDERLKVRSYVGETQTIDMSQQTGSLSNITKAVYRIRWNDTGTVTLTLNTSGCVEGQRVTIFAETNDVSVSGKLIVAGRYMDFVFIAGDWRAPQDPWQ